MPNNKMPTLQNINILTCFANPASFFKPSHVETADFQKLIRGFTIEKYCHKRDFIFVILLLENY